MEKVKVSNWKSDYFLGFKDGIPVALGYIPIAIACGIMGAKSGLPLNLLSWLSALIYSGSGQGAAQNLYAAGETSIFVYALTLFIANCRYILLSISIAQRFDRSMKTLQRVVFGFFHTDEIFVVAMKKSGELGSGYLFGLVTFPYITFVVSDIMGAFFADLMPHAISSALGIMLYAMFIALIVPPAKHSKKMTVVTLIAISMSVIMECIPTIKGMISPGFIIIICAIVTATAGAILFPVEEENDEVISNE